MSIPVSVVINCAGMGRRLGLSKTKALAHICGRPLIAWQLDALQWAKDLRVVVGYQANDVIEYVTSIRKDVIFAFNNEYQTTGTAASFVAGALGVKGLVLSLDGDLLVRPNDLLNFAQRPTSTLGVLPITTQEPLLAFLDSEEKTVASFGRQPKLDIPNLEWSGLCLITAEQIKQSCINGYRFGHMYELLTPHLPLPAMQIDAREIDTPDDFERAQQWLELHAHEWDKFRLTSK